MLKIWTAFCSGAPFQAGTHAREYRAYWLCTYERLIRPWSATMNGYAKQLD